jgi:hypothetical protein
MKNKHHSKQQAANKSDTSLRQKKKHLDYSKIMEEHLKRAAAEDIIIEDIDTYKTTGR